MSTKSQTVLYITPKFSPATSAAVIRAVNFVDGLVRRGVKVIVLTGGCKAGIEEVSENLTVCQISPDGQLPTEFDGHGLQDWPMFSVLPGPDKADKSWKGFYRGCQWLIKKYTPELLFATGPPFYLLALIDNLAEIHRLPLVLEFRDAWYTGMPWPYNNVLQRRSGKNWERRCVINATKIITVTEAYRQILIDTYGSSIVEKTVTVRHGFANYDKDDKKYTEKDRPFTIAYTGQLRGLDIVSAGIVKNVFYGLGRNIKRIFLGANFCEKLRLDWMSPHYLMAAIAKVGQVNPEFKSKARLVFTGQEFSQIDVWASQMGMAENVCQKGPLPPKEAWRIAREADLLVLTLYGIKDCPYHWCVPSKIYTYLGTGNPILSLLPPGEAMELVKRAGTGIIARPDDVCDIAKQLSRLFEEHSKGVASVKPDWGFIRQFELSAQQEKFSDVILSALESTPGARL